MCNNSTSNDNIKYQNKEEEEETKRSKDSTSGDSQMDTVCHQVTADEQAVGTKNKNNNLEHKSKMKEATLESHISTHFRPIPIKIIWKERSTYALYKNVKARRCVRVRQKLWD